MLLSRFLMVLGFLISVPTYAGSIIGDKDYLTTEIQKIFYQKELPPEAQLSKVPSRNDIHLGKKWNCSFYSSKRRDTTYTDNVDNFQFGHDRGNIYRSDAGSFRKAVFTLIPGKHFVSTCKNEDAKCDVNLFIRVISANNELGFSIGDLVVEEPLNYDPQTEPPADAGFIWDDYPDFSVSDPTKRRRGFYVCSNSENSASLSTTAPSADTPVTPAAARGNPVSTSEQKIFEEQKLVEKEVNVGSHKRPVTDITTDERPNLAPAPAANTSDSSSSFVNGAQLASVLGMISGSESAPTPASVPAGEQVEKSPEQEDRLSKRPKNNQLPESASAAVSNSDVAMPDTFAGITNPLASLANAAAQVGSNANPAAKRPRVRVTPLKPFQAVAAASPVVMSSPSDSIQDLQVSQTAEKQKKKRNPPKQKSDEQIAFEAKVIAQISQMTVSLNTIKSGNAVIRVTSLKELETIAKNIETNKSRKVFHRKSEILSSIALALGVEYDRLSRLDVNSEPSEILNLITLSRDSYIEARNGSHFKKNEIQSLIDLQNARMNDFKVLFDIAQFIYQADQIVNDSQQREKAINTYRAAIVDLEKHQKSSSFLLHYLAYAYFMLADAHNDEILKDSKIAEANYSKAIEIYETLQQRSQKEQDYTNRIKEIKELRATLPQI